MKVFSVLSFLFLTSSFAGAQGLPLDDCGLAGKTFRSVNEYEIGLGPDGPVLGHWKVKFKDISGEAPSYGFKYDYSDVVATGYYSCAGAEGKISTTNQKFKEGYYKATHSLLLWDGKWFQEDC